MIAFIVAMLWIILGVIALAALLMFVVDKFGTTFAKLFDHHRDFGIWVALRYQIFGRTKIRVKKPVRNSGQWPSVILTPDEIREILGLTGHDDGAGVQ